MSDHIDPVSRAIHNGMLPDFTPSGTWFRHLKTGGLYRFIRWGIDTTRQAYVAIYQSVDAGDYYVRDAAEFLDGRFERTV